ncbi:hypothetical protein R83H12_02398 [Fibrobacteria bacterium R8-3-H12]
MNYISEILGNLLNYIYANKDNAIIHLITIVASIITIVVFIIQLIRWLISLFKSKTTTTTQTLPIKPKIKKPINIITRIIGFTLLLVMICIYATVIISWIDSYKSKTPFDDILCKLDNYNKCYILGNSLTEDNGVKQDFCKAKNAYETACNGGITKACNALALIYDEGKCTAIGQNIKEAIRLYDKACTNYIKTACNRAGLRYEYGGKEFSVNVEKALKYYEKACEKNGEDDNENYEEFCDNHDKLFKNNYVKDGRNYRDYKIKQIGAQTWFMEDLQYKYVKYNWFDALTACPSGWRLPNNEDWDLLKTNTNDQDLKDFSEKSNGYWWSADEYAEYGYYGYNSIRYNYWAYIWIVKNKVLKKEVAATDNYRKDMYYAVRCVK